MMAVEDVNKAFETRIRLGIVPLLRVNNRITFAELKQVLNAADGKLASHRQP